MTETHSPNESPDGPGFYEIRIKGHLADRWADWFGEVTITLDDNGDTLLTGPIIDQAALHGVLKKVRNLGLTLISVSPIDQRGPTDVPVVKQ